MCFVVISFLFIFACSFTNPNLENKFIMSNIKIETPNDHYNILLKEHLKRSFRSSQIKNHRFLLKASISFISSDTLSNNGLNSLKKTVANIKYELFNLQLNKLIKSGTIRSFPTISSTTKSFYSNETSLKHDKDRLNLNISQKLYMHLNIILRRLK